MKKKGKLTTLYCVCRQPYDKNDTKPMIFCDYCKEWYHFECLGLDEDKGKSVKKYKCPDCKKKAEIKRKEKREAELALVQAQALAEAQSKPARFHCKLKGCKNMARPTSKYCKDDCGRESTRMIMRNIELLSRIRQTREQTESLNQFQNYLINILTKSTPKHQQMLKESNLTLMATPSLDSRPIPCNLSDSQIKSLLSEFTELRSMQETMHSFSGKIHELENKRVKLEQYIGEVQTKRSEEIETEVDVDKRGADIIDCVSCGHPITVKRFAKHLDQCVSKAFKNEKFMIPRVLIDDTHTVMLCNYFDPRIRCYCSRLKSSCHVHQAHAKKMKPAKKGEICGCPLDDDFVAFCKSSSVDCLKHSGWEKVKLSDLVQQKCIQEVQKQWQAQEIMASELSLMNKKMLYHPVLSKEGE